MAKLARYIDQDSAKNLLRQAIAMHKEKRVSDRSHSFAYNVLADIYIKEQKVDSALVIYEEAYTFFSELKNPTCFLKIAPTYGTTLVENNEISLGIEIFNKGIKIALDKNQYADLGYLYAYLGNIMLHQQRDFERANIIFRKGLVACDKILIESGYNKANDLTTSNYDRIRSTINTGLTELYSKKMQYDSAIYFGNKAVDQALKVEYFQKALIANNLLSKAHLKKKSYESAEYFNNNALSLFSKVKDLSAMAESQIISMSILLSQNRLEECITLGNIILNKDKRVLNSEMKAEIYNKLFEANMILGNKKQIISSKDSFLHYTNQKVDGAVLRRLTAEGGHRIGNPLHTELLRRHGLLRAIRQFSSDRNVGFFLRAGLDDVGAVGLLRNLVVAADRDTDFVVGNPGNGNFHRVRYPAVEHVHLGRRNDECGFSDLEQRRVERVVLHGTVGSGHLDHPFVVVLAEAQVVRRDAQLPEAAGSHF